MINFSGISNKNVMGRVLRFPLKLIPRNMIIPILQGRLKGKKWIVGSSNHGCWLGSYEYEKAILFTKTVKKGSVVYDIGAHVGFYTLLASELVGPNGKVVAFEPFPQNIYYLKKHLSLNRCNNVKVIESAVTDSNGVALFEAGRDTSTGCLSPMGDIEVKTISLDNLVLKNEIPLPDYMKIDVEGTEFSVLNGAKSILANHTVVLFLSTHGNEVHKKCLLLLESIGYKLESIGKKDIDNSNEIIAYKR